MFSFKLRGNPWHLIFSPSPLQHFHHHLFKIFTITSSTLSSSLKLESVIHVYILHCVWRQKNWITVPKISEGGKASFGTKIIFLSGFGFPNLSMIPEFWEKWQLVRHLSGHVWYQCQMMMVSHDVNVKWYQCQMISMSDDISVRWWWCQWKL